MKVVPFFKPPVLAEVSPFTTNEGATQRYFGIVRQGDKLYEPKPIIFGDTAADVQEQFRKLLIGLK